MTIKQRANKKRAIQAADYILDKYYIQNPAEIPFQDLLGAENVFYQERELNGCLGNMIRQKSKGIITISSSIGYEKQKRFVTAHELGHWLMHKDVPNFNCDDNKLYMWHGNGSKYEVEANTFAAELLMPTMLFKSECQKKEFSSELILNLASTFQTSITATSFRFSDIGNESIMVVYSKGRRVRWYKPSDDFAFSFYENKFQVPSNSLTSDYYRGKISAPDKDITLAKSWFSKDYQVQDDTYLHEAIIPLPALDACITFLWQHNVNFADF